MDLLDELRELITEHAAAPSAARHAAPVDGVIVAVTDRPTTAVASVTEPSLAIVAQGVKRTVLGGEPYDYRAGQYLVVSLDLPVTGQALQASPEEPFAVFWMRLRPEEIASLLLETGGSAAPTPSLGLAVSDATPELLDPVVRLLRLAGHPDDLRVLGPAYRREILWRLTTGDQGAMIRQIGRSDSSLMQVARAIRWIREHFREPLRIADLAALAAMSPSAFHRNFRAATSMTPIQFQKNIRLQTARTLLAARSGTVAEIGYRVGYESPSQFTREYGKMFGISPGRDAGGVLTPSLP